MAIQAIEDVMAAIDAAKSVAALQAIYQAWQQSENELRTRRAEILAQIRTLETELRALRIAVPDMDNGAVLIRQALSRKVAVIAIGLPER